MRTRIIAGSALATWALAATPALAQDATTAASLAFDLDVVWVALCAGLVFFMQAGFAAVEAGLTRSKNAANIVAKNLADMMVGGVAYWAVGGAIAYGASRGGLFGGSGFLFQPDSADAVLGGDGVQFLYQLVFAATAATIVSGAVAERMKFAGYLVMSLALTGLIYPIVSHWQWGGGWLSAAGFYDFAGSSVVHLTGGVAGLVGAMVLGPRLGKYGRDGRPRAIPGHNLPLAVMGVFILWLGWFGFNGGSTLAAQGNGQAIGHILVTTMLAGAAAGLVAAGVSWVVSGKPDPAMAGNGVLAGLVGITAGPDLAGSIAAVTVGAICGAAVVGSVRLLDRLRVDDPVGAVSVHGTCGAIGTLAVGFYPAARAAGYSVATQALGVLAIALFVGAASAAVFLTLRATVGVRVSEREEIEGLDVHEHGVAGYAPDSYGGAGRAIGAGAPAPAGAAVRAVNPSTS